MRDSFRQQLITAGKIISSGGVVAYPTESCFGLGCNPKDHEAVKKVLNLKRRSASKGLIIIGHDYSQLKPFIRELPNKLVEKMINSWPAAITWLVPAAIWVPKWLTGSNDNIAIRVPDHRIARKLCKYCDHALVSTSANLSGQRKCRSKNQIKSIFQERVNYIIDYRCGGLTQPSRIIDIETNQIIR